MPLAQINRLRNVWELSQSLPSSLIISQMEMISKIQARLTLRTRRMTRMNSKTLTVRMVKVSQTTGSHPRQHFNSLHQSSACASIVTTHRYAPRSSTRQLRSAGMSWQWNRSHRLRCLPTKLRSDKIKKLRVGLKWQIVAEAPDQGHTLVQQQQEVSDSWRVLIRNWLRKLL